MPEAEHFTCMYYDITCTQKCNTHLSSVEAMKTFMEEHEHFSSTSAQQDLKDFQWLLRLLLLLLLLSSSSSSPSDVVAVVVIVNDEYVYILHIYLQSYAIGIEEVTFSSKQKQDRKCFIHKTVLLWI